MTRVLGIDVGGTQVKTALFEIESGMPVRVEEVQRQSTQIGSLDGSELIEQLLEIIRSYGSSLSSVGVVTPGLIDESRGLVRYAANLHVRDLLLRDRLESATGLRVGLGHDGRATALAEQVLGAGLGFNNFALMPIGTGISVGLVIDGAVRAADGLIGEIGHANVGHNEKCACGLTGCLEVVASTAGIARRYAALTGIDLDARAISQRAADGDASALAIWNDALDAIALSCDWLLNILSPEAIVFAGGLSMSGQLLTEPVAARLSSRISFQRVPEIRLAVLGEDAGCVGAALLAARRLDLS